MSASMAQPISLPDDWEPYRYLLYNRSVREAGKFSVKAAEESFLSQHGVYRFEDNPLLPNKRHVVTLLGYSRIKQDGSRHTNWFPWNRFRDVFETIGYRTEWCELSQLERHDEPRIFIAWNEPSSLDLVRSGKLREGDLILQKLTSLGKGMEQENWTADASEWSSAWEWPLYRSVEFLADLGVPIHAFGCRTDPTLFREKTRLVDRLEGRLHWIPWGGTPFSWREVLEASPVMSGFEFDAAFVGSKWGKIGRGNLDAWDRYLTPLENDPGVDFRKFGGIGEKMVSDEEMVALLRKARLCPIIHAPSWQAEKGVQDRFYTVFLSGRFGIADNEGVTQLLGQEFDEIVAVDPTSFHRKSVHFINNIEQQLQYVSSVQHRLKTKFNFYDSWYDLLSALPELSTNA